MFAYVWALGFFAAPPLAADICQDSLQAATNTVDDILLCKRCRDAPTTIRFWLDTSDTSFHAYLAAITRLAAIYSDTVRVIVTTLPASTQLSSVEHWQRKLAEIKSPLAPCSKYLLRLRAQRRLAELSQLTDDSPELPLAQIVSPQPSARLAAADDPERIFRDAIARSRLSTSLTTSEVAKDASPLSTAIVATAIEATAIASVELPIWKTDSDRYNQDALHRAYPEIEAHLQAASCSRFPFDPDSISKNFECSIENNPASTLGQSEPEGTPARELVERWIGYFFLRSATTLRYF